MKAKNIRTLAFTLALPLALSLGACTEDVDYPLVPGEGASDASQVGVVEFRVDAAQASAVSQVDVVITDAAGASVHTSTVSLDPNDHSATIVLALPAGPGYSMAVSAKGDKGTKCEGKAAFNVIAGQTVNVPLTLSCVTPGAGTNNNGNVKIEIKMESKDRECPEISMISALPDQAKIGKQMRLSSTASEDGVSFSWTASSGSFSDPKAANTDFTCSKNGPVTLTLAVETSPDCKKEHSIEVTCDFDDNPGDAKACADIVSACHDKDPKDGGAISKCHHIGHKEDQTVCEAEKSRCVELCQKAAAPAKTVEINFEARVGSEAFECNKTYKGLGSTGNAEASPNDFRFYVHDLALVKADGSEAPVTIEDRGEWQRSGIALVDFEGGPSAGCYGGSAGTNLKVTGTVAHGDYVGLKFRTGVPAAFNHLDPSTLEAPLNASGMIWSWLSGFKFLKLELGVHVLHVGSTACSGTPPNDVTCAKPNRNEIVLKNFNPGKDVVVADVASVFANSDLSTEQGCHSSGDACKALFEAVGLNYEDGSATSSQRMFRVKK